jgi:hypothetical protein
MENKQNKALVMSNPGKDSSSSPYSAMRSDFVHTRITIISRLREIEAKLDALNNIQMQVNALN